MMFELTRVLCRTALIDAHTNAITASDTTSDRKHLATVSLDSTLKVSLNINCVILKSFCFICITVIEDLNMYHYKISYYSITHIT